MTRKTFIKRKPRSRMIHKRVTKSRGVARQRRRRIDKPTVGRESAIVKDRTMIKFPATYLTSGQFGTSYGPTKANGYGFLPFQVSNMYAPALAEMCLFSPQYNVEQTGSSGQNALTNFRILPGNSLCQYTQSSASGGTAQYSDIYGQALPTGVGQWGALYQQYFCHGSSVEVTIVDCSVPGELCVIPISLFDVNTSGANPYDFIITGNATYQGSTNLGELLTFRALPDDQPYAKIKLVSSAGGMDRVKIKHAMTTRKFLSVPNIKDNISNSGQLLPYPVVNTTPSNGIPLDPTQNQWGWFIAFLPTAVIPLTSSAPYASIQVKVTYFCELVNRVEIPFHGLSP